MRILGAHVAERLGELRHVFDVIPAWLARVLHLTGDLVQHRRPEIVGVFGRRDVEPAGRGFGVLNTVAAPPGRLS